MPLAILGISGSKRKKKRKRENGRDDTLGVMYLVGGFFVRISVCSGIVGWVGFRAFSEVE
jgi:hypothetical protein